MGVCNFCGSPHEEINPYDGKCCSCKKHVNRFTDQGLILREIKVAKKPDPPFPELNGEEDRERRVDILRRRYEEGYELFHPEERIIERSYLRPLIFSHRIFIDG